MRAPQVLGVVLILAGVFVLWQRPTYRTRQEVLRVGEFKASMEQREAVPAWIGAIAVGVGVVLLLGDRRRA